MGGILDEDVAHVELPAVLSGYIPASEAILERGLVTGNE